MEYDTGHQALLREDFLGRMAAMAEGLPRNISGEFGRRLGMTPEQRFRLGGNFHDKLARGQAYLDWRLANANLEVEGDRHLIEEAVELGLVSHLPLVDHLSEY